MAWEMSESSPGMTELGTKWWNRDTSPHSSIQDFDPTGTKFYEFCIPVSPLYRPFTGSNNSSMEIGDRMMP